MFHFKADILKLCGVGNIVSIVSLNVTRTYTKLFTENITKYFAHAQAVCTRPLLGGEGPGNKATEPGERLLPDCTVYTYMVHVGVGRFF